jgi:hypothetical protein
MAMSESGLIPGEPRERIPLARILMATVGAIGAAIVANVIVFFIGDAAGAFPDDYRFSPPGGGETGMGVGNVIFSTITFLAIAGIVFAIISRVSGRPVRIFLYVAAVALVLSFFQPFTLPDPPGSMIAFLLLMHVVAAVVGVLVLLRLAVR